MSKLVNQYEYRGHRVTISEVKFEPFKIEILGTHVNICTEHYSLDGLNDAIESIIDSEMDQKLEAA